MLKLTVLLRYSDGGRKICDIIGFIDIDFENREIICDGGTALLNCKYSDIKKIICNLFTSNKSLKQIFAEIRKNGMKVEKARFYANDDKEIAILIED